MKASALLTLGLTISGAAMAVEPSPIEATGVVSEAFGTDASNWDAPPHNT